MFCPKCGKENPDNASICEECGEVFLETKADTPADDAADTAVELAGLPAGEPVEETQLQIEKTDAKKSAGRSTSRKIITAAAVLLVLAGLAGGAVLLKQTRDNSSKRETASMNETVKVTAVIAETSSDATKPPDTTKAPEAPKVITGYELKDTRPYGSAEDNLMVGFIVTVPKIDSNKPGAKSLNKKFDEIKKEILTGEEHNYQSYKSSDNYTLFNGFSYHSFQYDSMIFIETYIHESAAYGEYNEIRQLYIYDYLNDEILDNDDFSKKQYLTMEEIISELNSANIGDDEEYTIEKLFSFADNIGDRPVSDFITLYSKKDGKLGAFINYRLDAFDYSIHMERRDNGEWVLTVPASGNNGVEYGKLYVVATKGADLNVRYGPGLDYPVSWKIHNRSKICVLDRFGDWVRVEFECMYGWVSDEYIKSAP